MQTILQAGADAIHFASKKVVNFVDLDQTNSITDRLETCTRSCIKTSPANQYSPRTTEKLLRL
jgi:hypothetical protein